MQLILLRYFNPAKYFRAYLSGKIFMKLNTYEISYNKLTLKYLTFELIVILRT